MRRTKSKQIQTILLPSFYKPCTAIISYTNTYLLIFCPEKVSRSLFFPSTAEDTTHDDTIVNNTENPNLKQKISRFKHIM